MDLCEYSPCPGHLDVGQYIDIQDLLTTKTVSQTLYRYSDGSRVKLGDIYNKYLVIRCVSLPLKLNNHDCEELFEYHAALIDSYPELSAMGDFEMITVVKTTDHGDDDEAAFYDFLYNDPGLIIPFEESDSRDFVCNFLGLEPMVWIILDKGHKVLRKDDCGKFFSWYGAAFYPFTNAKVEALDATRTALLRRLTSEDGDISSGSLMDLLSCKPSDKLKRLRGGEDDYMEEEEEIRVGELSKMNCVGVYFCVNERLLEKLVSVYEECKAENLEFEIVLFLKSYSSVPPDIDDFKFSFSRFESISSWWILEWSDARSRQLMSVCYDSLDDNLMIVRPEGKCWEQYGKSIVLSDGIASYPFTKESILERMTSLTLDRLLSGSDDDPNLLTCLRNKNVLVYVSEESEDKERLYYDLEKDHYYQFITSRSVATSLCYLCQCVNYLI